MRAPDFPPDVVAAVCRHMNDDHRADALLICRTLGGVPDADEVTTTGFDRDALLLRASGPRGERSVRVPWPAPVTERAEVRRAVVELYERACAAVGIEPRRH